MVKRHEAFDSQAHDDWAWASQSVWPIPWLMVRSKRSGGNKSGIVHRHRRAVRLQRKLSGLSCSFGLSGLSCFLVEPDRPDGPGLSQTCRASKFSRGTIVFPQPARAISQSRGDGFVVGASGVGQGGVFLAQLVRTDYIGHIQEHKEVYS
jgi:hypothetical protein